MKLIIVFLILYLILNLSNGINFDCQYMKDALNLPPTSIYTISNSNNNNLIISRNDIINNSTSIQLFNISSSNNNNQQYQYVSLMELIDSKTILLNFYNQTNNSGGGGVNSNNNNNENSKNNISILSNTDNKLENFQQNQNQTFISNPIFTVINNSSDCSTTSSIDFFGITGTTSDNKDIIINYSNQTSKIINLNSTISNSGNTDYYFDKLSMDYFIVNNNNNSNNSTTTTNEIIMVNLKIEKYITTFKLEITSNDNNDQFKIISIFNKTLLYSSSSSSSTLFKVNQIKLVENEINYLNNTNQLLFELNYNISNIIPCENQNFIILYSISSKMLFVYNLNNQKMEQYNNFLINLSTSESESGTSSNNYYSFISRGGIPINPYIEKPTSTPESIIKKDEKYVVPIVLPLLVIILILIAAMVIKTVLKKRKEKKNFIQLNDGGLLEDHNNINLDMPINNHEI